MNVVVVIHRNHRFVLLWDDDPRSVISALATLAEWLIDDDMEAFGEGEYLAAVGRVREMTT